MGLELKQSLKLSQSLVLTQQLQQAIKLLQLNHLELVEQVQNELLENPTLEEIPGTSADVVTDAQRQLETQTQAIVNDASEQNNGQGEDIDWQQVAAHLADDRPAGDRGSSGMDELPPIETNLVGAGSLADHLEWQLHMTSCTEGEFAAAHLILHNLDDRGWLAVSFEELIKEHELDREDAEGGLEIVQHLDPLGCAARSLEECLLIQVRILYPEDPFFPKLVEHHLPDIEKRSYAAIGRALDIEIEDVIEYHKMLKHLEPWPGRAYTASEPQYISPDVYVVKQGGEWVVSQNEDGLPKLRLSNHYRKVLLGKDNTREERDYIKERLSSAKFLIESIYKRQSTIGKVMKCILERQSEYFEKGGDFLKPMVLRDVAEEIGVHESTVSRATSNKYVHCPQGTLELKYFFNNGVNAVSGEMVAAESVKRRIKKLIAAEDPGNPLSDDAIVKLLQTENIDIARRTVAKYREAAGILPSSKRRNVC
ncbi:MAG: RNA polymerase sigma-54 factor [Myxococcales bacterium]|nr:RNA polymerase sigma-54 factor [Myxococcales bacterium]